MEYFCCWSIREHGDSAGQPAGSKPRTFLLWGYTPLSELPIQCASHGCPIQLFCPRHTLCGTYQMCVCVRWYSLWHIRDRQEEDVPLCFHFQVICKTAAPLQWGMCLHLQKLWTFLYYKCTHMYSHTQIGVLRAVTQTGLCKRMQRIRNLSVQYIHQIFQ